MALPPTLLVGPSGAGKTVFAETLAHILNIPCEIWPCVGPGGSAFIGRRDHHKTGQSLLPASVIRRHRHVSPLIVLDDIDRIDASLTLEIVLPGLPEPQTAASSHDPSLGALVNMSHIIWIGTATNWKAIPARLLDCFQLIGFPAPRREHLEVLVRYSLQQLMAEQGMDLRWASSLSQTK